MCNADGLASLVVSHPNQEADEREYAREKNGPTCRDGESREHGVVKKDDRPEQGSIAIFSGLNVIEDHNCGTDSDNKPHGSLVCGDIRE